MLLILLSCWVCWKAAEQSLFLWKFRELIPIKITLTGLVLFDDAGQYAQHQDANFITCPHLALDILRSSRRWGWWSTTCLFVHRWRHWREENFKRLQIQVFGFLGQLHGVEQQDYKIWGLECVKGYMKKAWDSNMSSECNIHSMDMRDVSSTPPPPTLSWRNCSIGVSGICTACG